MTDTPLDIPRLRELAAKATRRPWLVDDDFNHMIFAESTCRSVALDGREDDFRFITALANSADALLALAERAEAYRAVLDDIAYKPQGAATASHEYVLNLITDKARTALESKP